MQKAKSGYKLVKWRYGKKIEIPGNWLAEKFRHGIEFLTDYEANGSFEKLRDNVEVDKGKPFAWYVRGTDLENNRHGLVPGNRYCDKKTYDWLEKTRLHGGELLITKRGEIGKIYSMPYVEVPSTLGPNLYLILLKKNLNQKFAFYWLKNKLGNKEITRIDDSAVQGAMYKEPIKNCLVLFPSIQEQQKIVSILSNVDNLINKYDVIIKSTVRLKMGLMQTLLTKGIGHKKFKKVKWLFGKEIEIPENWIIKKIEDVFKLKSGSTPSRTNPMFFEGDIPWVTSTDLNRSQITSTLEKITSKAVKDTNLTILPKGTFLIATYGLEADGTRGKCGIIEMDATCNQACMAFLPSSEMNYWFLYYFYLYFGEKIIFSIAQGTKQQNLYSDTVKKVSLLIPPLKEQEKIIFILKSIDKKIHESQSQKTHLEKLKKGLMQKLLTGQIRVKV